MATLDSRLAEFAETLRGLSTGSESPKTAFELLGKSRYEDAWQAYLAYFLDPDEAHGLDDAFLAAFISQLEAADQISFAPPRRGLEANMASVTTERQSTDDNRPDIIVTSGQEWFLCLELKVHAPEGGGDRAQTIRYAEDDAIVPHGTSAYEDEGYLYLKPDSASSADASQFVDVSWTEVATVIKQFLSEQTASAPLQTVAQLSDFATLIDTHLHMSNLDSDTEKRKDLYFEYRDEILAAEEAVKPFVTTVLQQEWGEKLGNDHIPANATEWQWQYNAIGHDFGQVRIPRWKEAKHESEQLDIHWEHKPNQGDFTKGQVRFTLELEEPSRSTMDESSGERYQQFRADIIDEIESIDLPPDARWAEYDINPGWSDKKLIRFVYEFEPGDETGYYKSLQSALEDTEMVTELVTRLLDTTDYTEYPVN